MLDQLRKLVDLQKIDQSLGELLRRRENASRKVTEVEDSLEEENRQQKTWRERLSQRQADHEESQEQLRELESHLARLATKEAEVKTTKEYDALRKEREAAEERKGLLEREKIPGISQEIAQLEENLLKSEERIETLKATLEVVKREFEQVVEAISGQEKELTRKRDALAEEVKGALLRKYERIRKYKMGLGIAEAKDGSCTACHMHVPSNLYSKILRGELIECQSCQRILYHASLLEEKSSK